MPKAKKETADPQKPRFKTLKPEHILFAKEYAKSGNAADAYQAVYPTVSRTSARTNACLLLKREDIQKLVREQAARLQALVDQATVEELKQVQVKDVLTVMRRREILAEIAEGRAVYKEVVPTVNGGEIIVKLYYPTHADRIRAIEVYNKMAGDNVGDQDHPNNPKKALIDFAAMPVDMLKKLEQFVTNPSHNGAGNEVEAE